MDLDHDPRWIREGKPLREWLWILASPDEAIWRSASEPLNSMRYGLSPKLPAPRGTREYNNRRAVFEQVVVALLEDSSFRAAEWVTAMLANFKSLYVECFADRRETRGERRVSVLDLELPQSLLHVAGAVFARLPDLTRAALADRVTADTVAQALQRIGPAGEAFAPDFVTELDRSHEAEPVGVHFTHAEALGAVAGESQAVVRAMMERLGSDDAVLRAGAAETLEKMGPRAAVLAPNLIETLERFIDEQGRPFELCLASVGREQSHVFERFLTMAQHAPPRMRRERSQSGVEYEYNEVMWDRAVAIQALGYFDRFGERAVPVLVDALDNFEENNPDWNYELGTYGRIVTTLSKLGPAAALAVPGLAQRLKMDDGGIEWRVVKFFADLGPLAVAALPALRELDVEQRKERDPDESTYVNDDGSPDEFGDLVGYAIWRIEGRL